MKVYDTSKVATRELGCGTTSAGSLGRPNVVPQSSKKTGYPQGDDTISLNGLVCPVRGGGLLQSTSLRRVSGPEPPRDWWSFTSSNSRLNTPDGVWERRESNLAWATRCNGPVALMTGDFLSDTYHRNILLLA